MSVSQQITTPARVHARTVRPGQFHGNKYFYERVRNAPLHPLVASFLSLSNERVAERYARLHPTADTSVLKRLFAYEPAYFLWSGADLLHATTAGDARRMILLETNSCPSGQKSMPLANETQVYGGYRELLEKTFCRFLPESNVPDGVLAVLYDKNPLENDGYAQTLAELTGETVYCAQWVENETDPCVRLESGVLHVRDDAGAWLPVRAALRYLTQNPWRRVPPTTRTLVINPVVACLAGGRNKALADLAYADFNAEHADSGLAIATPRTWRGVRLTEIPWLVRRLGGFAVIKNPYSNAGQGVWTVTTQDELRAFLAENHARDLFLVQELIGDPAWNKGRENGCYHVGTVPDAHGETYAFDLRFMIACQAHGFRPVALYARRARDPLSGNALTVSTLSGGETPPPSRSWPVLGTNLSVKTPGGWQTETDRLLLMDWKDFPTLGLGLDELVEAFVQSVMATVAIDRMARRIAPEGRFDAALFADLNKDAAFEREVLT